MAKRNLTQDRATTTTRLYAETVQIFRLLAEAKGVPMIDYVEVLAREAAKRDGQVVIGLMQGFMAEPDQKDKKTQGRE